MAAPNSDPRGTLGMGALDRGRRNFEDLRAHLRHLRSHLVVKGLGSPELNLSQPQFSCLEFGMIVVTSGRATLRS